MARSPDWEKIPMATGGDSPARPLPTVTTKTCQRWHAGIDLTGAPNGALVIAPEDGLIVGVDKGWTDGTRAVFMRTESGLFLVLGGVIAGSHMTGAWWTLARNRGAKFLRDLAQNRRAARLGPPPGVETPAAPPRHTSIRALRHGPPARPVTGANGHHPRCRNWPPARAISRT